MSVAMRKLSIEYIFIIILFCMFSDEEYADQEGVVLLKIGANLKVVNSLNNEIIIHF